MEDEATENRSVLRALVTEDVNTILGSSISDELKHIMPMVLKTVFWHPIRTNMLIFISADMPHLVKKIANAFEFSGHEPTRDLKYKGKSLLFDKLEKIWLCDNGRIGDLGTNILIHDHFHKNSYTRMRLHVAVQMLSQSMVQMIDVHADKCGGGLKSMDLCEKLFVLLTGSWIFVTTPT